MIPYPPHQLIKKIPVQVKHVVAIDRSVEKFQEGPNTLEKWRNKWGEGVGPLLPGI